MKKYTEEEVKKIFAEKYNELVDKGFDDIIAKFYAVNEIITPKKEKITVQDLVNFEKFHTLKIDFDKFKHISQ